MADIEYRDGGLCLDKIDIDGNVVETIQDSEGRTEIHIDSSSKILSYRDSEGVMHENVGINAKQITAESIVLPNDAIAQVDERINNHIEPKTWYLPKFGRVDIKSETFYLTADPRWSTKDDVVCIQMYDDTDANAYQRLTLSYYYIKSTLTPLSGGGYDRTSVNENSVRLEFFAAKDIVEDNERYYVKKITKVDGEFYLTSTLKIDATGGNTTYFLDTHYKTYVKVNYEDSSVPDQTTLTNAIEVTQVIDTPDYNAWPVTKKLEHYCIADIDFGSFYSKNNVAISLKFQGSGSTAYRKRGLRITFFKNNTYAKKDKIKIGELVRLSGFNMKSFGTDPVRVKDPVLTNVFLEMWETRKPDCYPWNETGAIIYNGATGMIKNFPIETYFGDNFYGIQFFGLKKDEKNYMLDGDDDNSGIFVCSFSNVWSSWNASVFDDEMGVDGRELAYPNNEDSVSVDTANHINVLMKNLKGLCDGTIEIEGQIVTFTREMLEEHIDVGSWIDYYIGLQVFQMWDNASHNMILYTGSDKSKFYAYFYDLDNSIGGNYNQDILDHQYVSDTEKAMWGKFRDMYKDSIINRYADLRKSVLSVHNIEAIYKSYISGVPGDVVGKEVYKWGRGNIYNFEESLEYLKQRLNWLDETSFNLQ